LLSTSIQLTNVEVAIPGERAAQSLKSYLLSPGSRPRAASKALLHDISLSIKSGERVGIVGRNGSGKSTLLKAIAGIYPVSKGQRLVEGHITPIMAQGIGFDPELTLRQNIRLGLAYMDMLDAYSPAVAEEALAFAELTERADEPFKVLSTGFRARLAFAVSLIHVPEILILDEIFATGDAGFVQKASQAMLQRFTEAPIALLVSHDSNLIGNLCNRAVFMQNGRVAADGPTGEVLALYHQSLAG